MTGNHFVFTTFLVFVLLSVVVTFVACEEEDDVVSILQKSREAIQSRDSGDNEDVINEHYFTTVKEKSVWYQAFQSAEELFSVSWDFESVEFLQYLIQRVAKHYKLCVAKEQDLERAKCYAQLAPVLNDLARGTLWGKEHGEVSKDERYERGIIYICAAALVSHLSVLSTNSFEAYDSVGTQRGKQKPLITTLEKQQVMLSGYDDGVIKRRLDKISPVVLCDIKEHLWKPFEQICETRWHSLDNKNKIILRRRDAVPTPNNTSSAAAAAKVVPEPEKEYDENDFEEDYYNTEDVSSLKSVERIGGVHGTSRIKYRAQVHDYATKEIVYEAYTVGDPTSRSEAMDELTSSALKARTTVEKRALNEVEDFTREIYEVIRDVMASALAYLKGGKDSSL